MTAPHGLDPYCDSPPTLYATWKPEARVHAGAGWLDDVLPGWADKIDLASLDLISGCQCVLGQLVIDMASLPTDDYGSLDESWLDDQFEDDPPAEDAFGLWLDDFVTLDALPAIGEDWAMAMGFVAPWRHLPLGSTPFHRSYEILTELWRAEIEKRVTS